MPQKFTDTELSNILDLAYQKLGELGAEYVEGENAGKKSLQKYIDMKQQIMVIYHFLFYLLDDNGNLNAYWTAKREDKEFYHVISCLIQVADIYDYPVATILVP